MRPCARVHAEMSGKASVSRKVFVTNETRVRFFTCMHSFMRNKMLFSGKPLSTCFARVGFFPRVCTHVRAEVAMARKGLSASGACALHHLVDTKGK